MSGRPINQDRLDAIEFGFPTYTGAVHKKCGGTERYVNGGGCVRCARVIATEQREARRALKHQASLDNVEKVVARMEDDAAAREQAAIDDLM